MRNIAVSWQFCLYQMRRLLTSSRMALLMMLLCLFAVLYAAPVAEFAASHQRKVSAIGVLPVITSDLLSQMILMMGVVLMFSDAPFLDHNQLYLLMRSDRSTWALGQVMYIVVSSLLYFLVAVSICWLFMIPYIEFSADWGKIWMTLANQTENEVSMLVHTRVLGQYTVAEAGAFSLLLGWLASSVIGCEIFLVNAVSRTKIGLVLGAAQTVMGITIVNSLLDYKLHMFSPLSLSNLRLIDRSGLAKGYPSLGYAVVALLLTVAVLTCVIVKHAQYDQKYLETQI